MNTRILGIIPRDENINKAESEGKTTIELDPDLTISQTFIQLARYIVEKDLC